MQKGEVTSTPAGMTSESLVIPSSETSTVSATRCCPTPPPSTVAVVCSSQGSESVCMRVCTCVQVRVFAGGRVQPHTVWLSDVGLCPRTALGLPRGLQVFACRSRGEQPQWGPRPRPLTPRASGGSAGVEAAGRFQRTGCHDLSPHF